MADAGFRLAVEGEKEFKKALAEINAQIKVNKSELKLLTEEYKLNDAGMENLQSKQKALADAMELQGEKVKILEQRYKEAAEQYGETDTHVLRLKESMNLAAAELARTTAEWENNAKAIEEYNRNNKDVDDILRSIEASIEKNESELKLLEAQYRHTGEESELLAKKNDVLRDSIDKQEDKIRALSDALSEAEREYGDQSDAVEKYKKQLNDAQTELIEMEEQIKKNDDALQDSGDSAKPLGEALSGIADQLGIDIPPAIQNMSTGFGIAAAAAGGIAAAIKGAKEKMEEVAAYADDVLTESIISGVDTATYQELKYMEGLMDVNTETFTGALTKMKRSMDDATSGNENLAKRFEELDVEITNVDGTLRDSWDVFLETIDALGRMTNETERDAAAMDIMGKSAEDLNPLIDAGSAKMRQLAEEAREVGYVMSEDGLEAAGKYQDRLDRLSMTAETASNNIGLILVETLNMANGLGTMEDVKEAWDNLWKSAKATLDLLTFTDADTQFQKKMQLRKEMTEEVTDALDEMWEKMTDVYEMDVVYRDELAKINRESNPMFAKKYEWPSYATGTYNHPGGIALVGEEGPELVSLPAGSAVYTNNQLRNMRFRNGDTFIININPGNIKTFGDLVHAVESERLNYRMGYTGG